MKVERTIVPAIYNLRQGTRLESERKNSQLANAVEFEQESKNQNQRSDEEAENEESAEKDLAEREASKQAAVSGGLDLVV